MKQHLLTRIESNYDSFSKGQKKIAKFLEEHYDKAAFMTALKLGETVGVSESTVVRFATEIGYEGYPKLQTAMQEMIREKLTSLQRIEVTANRIGEKHVLDSVLNQDIERIKRTLEDTSKESFDRAIEHIINARRIYIYAGRSTSYLGSFLNYYYSMIFDNVHFINTHSKSGMYEQIFRISEEDVIIGISFPRYSTTAVDAVAFAHSKNAKVVTLTDSNTSPLAEYADDILLAKSDMAAVVDSLVAPLSILNALIVATVIRKKDDVVEAFQNLENVWKTESVYEKYEIEKQAMSQYSQYHVKNEDENE